MLFRDKNDFLITICKHQYTNDTAYYNAIMKLKQQLYKRHENLNMNLSRVCVKFQTRNPKTVILFMYDLFSFIILVQSIYEENTKK